MKLQSPQEFKLNESNQEVYILDPKLVKPNMEGFDYEGGSCTIIDISTLPNINKLSKYGDIKDIKEGNPVVYNDEDYFVAVKFKNNTEILSYGVFGFYIKTTDKLKKWNSDTDEADLNNLK